VSLEIFEGDLRDCNVSLSDSLPVFSPARGVFRDHLIIGFDGRDVRARPFHLLRTSISKELAPDRPNLIGITSASPGDGKSFISLNLAAALSRVNEADTGLLDLDLRRGRIAAEIGLDVSEGLSDYLSGTVESLGSLGRRIANTKLDIYPTRAVAASSAELLAGERLEKLVRTLRSQAPGSVFLFDLPPVYANDDTMLVTQHLDGYILVVDAGSTTRKQLEGMMQMLQPTSCLGTIMNRYQGGVLDAYGYGYGQAKQYSGYYK
jgi:protein-tyrosine kinase